MDVADVIRPYPEVIDYLQHVKDDSFMDELIKLDGGPEAGTLSTIIWANTACAVLEKSM